MTNTDETDTVLREQRAPGTSSVYLPGRHLRRYQLLYILAAAGIATVWGGIGSILMPFQIQNIEFANVFTGSNASIDIATLTDLRAAVSAGTISPTAAQNTQLALLSRYEAARAGGLGAISAVSIAVGMFVTPIAGALSDRTRSRWGRRAPWILIGAVLGGALLVAARYSPTVGVLLVTYTLSQVALNLAPGALNATVPDRVPASSIGAMSGVAGFGTLLGTVVGTVVAGILFA